MGGSSVIALAARYEPRCIAGELLSCVAPLRRRASAIATSHLAFGREPIFHIVTVFAASGLVALVSRARDQIDVLGRRFQRWLRSRRAIIRLLRVGGWS